MGISKYFEAHMVNSHQFSIYFIICIFRGAPHEKDESILIQTFLVQLQQGKTNFDYLFTYLYIIYWSANELGIL